MLELPDNFQQKMSYTCVNPSLKNKNKEFIKNIINGNFTTINMDLPSWVARDHS